MPTKIPAMSQIAKWVERIAARVPIAIPITMLRPRDFDCVDATDIFKSSAIAYQPSAEDGLTPVLSELLRFTVVRLLGLVTDLADFAHHLAQVHAGERLEQCRHLRGHLGQVARDLVQS